MVSKKQFTIFKAGSLNAIPLFSAIAILFSGCGKNETAGGAFGTATGALVGTAVAGRHDKATGAVIGGLVGNILGREVGKNADENELLKKSYDRWCQDCGRKVTLFGAQSCPRCGGCLIRYKYCQECGAKFEAQCGYKFCPYCPRKRLYGRT